MSEGSTSHNPKLSVILALITVAGGIAAAYVTTREKPRIESAVATAATASSVGTATAATSSERTTAASSEVAENWIIRGAVVEGGGKRPVKSAVVVLVPANGQIITTTGDDGSFHFSGVPAGTYALVVKESDGGLRVQIPRVRPDGSNVLVGEAPELQDHPKAYVSYKIEKK